MAVAKKNTKTLLSRVKNARAQLEGFLKDRSWIEEAKKAAEKQGSEVRKMIDSDVAKLRGFIEKERKELEKLHAQIPGEVGKLKKFVDGRKKELSKLLTNVKSTAGKKTKKAKGSAKKKVARVKKTLLKTPPKKAGGTKKTASNSAAGPSN